MLVAIASAAALGLTAATGVSFNITTTQVSTVMYYCNYYVNIHSLVCRYFHSLFSVLVWTTCL